MELVIGNYVENMMTLGRSCPRNCYANQLVDSQMILLEVTQQAFEQNLCQDLSQTKLRENFQNDPDKSTFTQVIVLLGEMKVTCQERILSE